MRMWTAQVFRPGICPLERPPFTGKIKPLNLTRVREIKACCATVKDSTSYEVGKVPCKKAIVAGQNKCDRQYIYRH